MLPSPDAVRKISAEEYEQLSEEFYSWFEKEYGYISVSSEHLEEHKANWIKEQLGRPFEVIEEHCVVNGKQCTRCCEVLQLNDNRHVRTWYNFIKANPEYKGKTKDEKDTVKTFKMLRMISKRRAKKINKFLVDTMTSLSKKDAKNKGTERAQSIYFTCVHFDGKKCTNYENRPDMCSLYPRYGRKTKECTSSDIYAEGNCTWTLKLGE